MTTCKCGVSVMVSHFCSALDHCWVPSRPLSVSSEQPKGAGCLDCGMPYRDFPLDMLFPRAQWLAIHPDESGLLCANCMVRRASKIPGATVVHAVVEVSPAS